ncbi:unnamed protein product, partial [Iphiclides podalirius]
MRVDNTPGQYPYHGARKPQFSTDKRAVLCSWYSPNSSRMFHRENLEDDRAVRNKSGGLSATGTPVNKAAPRCSSGSPPPGCAGCGGGAGGGPAAAGDEEPRASSLPPSPVARRRLDDAPKLNYKGDSSAELRRRGSCESGIFSVANEELCRQPSAYGAVCPCSLNGCHRCWWRRGPEPPEAGEALEAREAPLRVCAECLVVYDWLLARGRRSLSEAAPAEGEAPFLCGPPSAEPAESAAYHVLSRCCCSARDDEEPARALSRAQHKRTSSVYTDSSEDVASLGSDSVMCDERPPRSAQISRIVEYFERAGAAVRCERSQRGPRYTSAGPREPRRRGRLTVCEGAVRSKLPLFDRRP